MKELLIIDGYNVIFSYPEYKKLMKLNPELARARFIEDLVEYRAFQDIDILVVFDATRVDFSVNRRSKILGVGVMFTAKGKTADSVIEKLVFKKSEREKVTVVTSDYLEQKIVFGKGVWRKTPGELVQDMKMLKKQLLQEDYGSKNPSISRLQVENRLDKEVKEALRQLIFTESE
jgi:predicted RNA-binding protein with PIN domain